MNNITLTKKQHQLFKIFKKEVFNNTPINKIDIHYKESNLTNEMICILDKLNIPKVQIENNLLNQILGNKYYILNVSNLINIQYIIKEE